MMNAKKNFLKGWGLLFIALSIAGITFWLALNYLSSKESLLRDEILNEKVQKIAVVVAANNLLPGDVINLETMALAEVDAINVSAFAIRPEDFNKVQGKIIRYPMSSGEPLLQHFLAGDAIERFSDLLESNERAVTLEIDSLSSAAGMLVTGDFIDIMLLMEAEDTEFSDDNKNLRALLQNVRVLSVDAYPLHSKKQDFVIAANNEGLIQYSNITVGVNFDDAAKLILARDVGDIVFMLRNKSDHLFHDADLISRLDLDKKQLKHRTYQFYSANVGGVIDPVSKAIDSSSSVDNHKHTYSVPLIDSTININTDTENNSH